MHYDSISSDNRCRDGVKMKYVVRVVVELDQPMSNGKRR